METAAYTIGYGIGLLILLIVATVLVCFLALLLVGAYKAIRAHMAAPLYRIEPRSRSRSRSREEGRDE